MSGTQFNLFGAPTAVIPDGRRDIGLPNWLHATKFDTAGAALADRHYSRRKPGSPQFMPPGETVVLITADGSAVFGWWRPHPASGLEALNGLDGWTCSIFRNEGRMLSSVLILEAEQALELLGKTCGPDGLLTYVWSAKVRSSNPGCCFKKAGWKRIGKSADGRKVLLQKPCAWSCAYCAGTGVAYDPQTGEGPICPECNGAGRP